MPAAEHLEAGLVSLEKLLADWPHPAAVIGGVGIIARVSPRHTDDIDVVVVVPDGAAEALIAAGLRTGFQLDPRQGRELLEAGLLRLVLRPEDVEPVGVDLIFVDSAFLAGVVRRATPVDMGPCTLRVATVEDLLLLKLEANRPEDVDDILAIKDAFGATLDMAHVRAEAARLDLVAALDVYFGSEPPRGGSSS
jgi:hypothetical protein